MALSFCQARRLEPVLRCVWSKTQLCWCTGLMTKTCLEATKIGKLILLRWFFHILSTKETSETLWIIVGSSHHFFSIPQFAAILEAFGLRHLTCWQRGILMHFAYFAGTNTASWRTTTRKKSRRLRWRWLPAIDQWLQQFSKMGSILVQLENLWLGGTGPQHGVYTKAPLFCPVMLVCGNPTSHLWYVTKAKWRGQVGAGLWGRDDAAERFYMVISTLAVYHWPGKSVPQAGADFPVYLCPRVRNSN